LSSRIRRCVDINPHSRQIVSLWITPGCGPSPSVPTAIVRDMDEQPFLGTAAVRQRLVTAYQLRTRYRAVHRNVYVPRESVPTAATRARAAWLWSGGDAVLAGISAAAVLGTKWLDDNRPAELIRLDRHGPANLRLHTWDVSAGETCIVRDMRCTTPARTAFDIGRTLEPDVAIPILDALMNATRLKPADVLAVADARPRHRGVQRLRAAIALSDAGAESPQESRVRLLLVRAGLPDPETQIEFRDQYGKPHIRVDMGWRQWCVAVEYDGVQHWTDRRQRSWDIDRIAILEAMGWVVIRVSAEMLSRPDVVVARVTNKLRAAGCPI
jgi:very-short-patch-repair endonuclease